MKDCTSFLKKKPLHKHYTFSTWCQFFPAVAPPPCASLWLRAGHARLVHFRVLCPRKPVVLHLFPPSLH